MTSSRPRPAMLVGLLTVVLAITAATQGPKFTGGYFKTTDGTSVIGLDFDTTGVISVYVDNQPFSTSTWSVKADTMSIGPVTGPPESSCANSAKYLWALAENRLSFTLIADDCQVRSNALLNLVWTRG